MIRSMTGFGQAEGNVGSVHVVVDVRTVNHRFFSPSIKLPGSFSFCEPEVREAMRQRVSRGHVTVSVRAEKQAESALNIDEVQFSKTVERLRELAFRYGLDGGVDLSTVLRTPGVIAGEAESAPASAAGESSTEFVALVVQALNSMTRTRQEEGERLREFLQQRLVTLESAMSNIALRAPERLAEHRDRLREAVKELTEGLAVDEARIAQEIAILADKLDIAEEIDRFKAHVAAFRATLSSDGEEPVGKRLGFLLQEMLREVNTTGSKAADAVILHEVVGMKEELERIREQVENLE